jgi:AGZA family xanthine/uracil permease-like MFS transporter
MSPQPPKKGPSGRQPARTGAKLTTRPPAAAATPGTRAAGLDGYFSITQRGSTLGREVRGGFATFFTMAYIVVLNPIILTGALVGQGGYVPKFAAIAATTALVAGVMTMLMGVVGRYPFALAAGLGINGVVAFQLAPQIGYVGAMGVVVLEGIVITILVLTGVRELLFNAIPLALKQAIGVGIGLFLAFIGFVDGGLVSGNKGGAPVVLGVRGSLATWPHLIFVVSLFVTAVLVVRRVRGAILIGIITSTVLAVIVQAVAKLGAVGGPSAGHAAPDPRGWALTVPSLTGKSATIDFSSVGHFSLPGTFHAGVILGILFVFTLMLADFFDTMGTVVAVGGEAGQLTPDGKLPGIRNVLLIDSVAAAAGGAGGVSSNTTFIESAAGVGEGARTGLASVVTGLLFLLAIFLSPLTQIVPSEAAAPVLVIVGFLLMTQVKDIPWDDWDIALPAFLAIVVMPFTFSITNGIGAGFIAYVLLKVTGGRSRDVHPLLWVTAVLFVIYFAIEPIKTLFNIH